MLQTLEPGANFATGGDICPGSVFQSWQFWQSRSGCPGSGPWASSTRHSRRPFRLCSARTIARAAEVCRPARPAGLAARHERGESLGKLRPVRKRISTRSHEVHGGTRRRAFSKACPSAAGSRPPSGRLEGGSAILGERKRAESQDRLCSPRTALPPSRAQARAQRPTARVRRPGQLRVPPRLRDSVLKSVISLASSSSNSAL
jgi:hypothetical protein